jgi:phosphocarrier protein
VRQAGITERSNEEWSRMIREQVVISNKLGLHARAAAKLVHTASAFESEIYIGTDHEEVNAKSILGILTLAATKGTTLTVRVEGDDEQAAVAAILTLFEEKFGEGQ